MKSIERYLWANIYEILRCARRWEKCAIHFVSSLLLLLCYVRKLRDFLATSSTPAR